MQVVFMDLEPVVVILAVMHRVLGVLVFIGLEEQREFHQHKFPGPVLQ